MTTLITTFVTWALTAFTKNTFVDKFSPNRLLFVRMLAALFALISAVLVALISHSGFDSSLIGIFVDALAGWLGALGVYHFPKSS